jgi:lysine 2,3-aminomutase
MGQFITNERVLWKMSSLRYTERCSHGCPKPLTKRSLHESLPLEAGSKSSGSYFPDATDAMWKTGMALFHRITPSPTSVGSSLPHKANVSLASADTLFPFSVTPLLSQPLDPNDVNKPFPDRHTSSRSYVGKARLGSSGQRSTPPPYRGWCIAIPTGCAF